METSKKYKEEKAPKDPDLCLVCKTMLCCRVSASDWCPILTAKKQSNSARG
jgi:hypothetical protein